MVHCHICHTELPENDGKRIVVAEFHRIVHNGFNPFTENFRFSFGLAPADLGFTGTQATEILYANWKLQALSSRTDWLLCEACYRAARLYVRKWWHLWKPKATDVKEHGAAGSHCLARR